MNKRRHKMEEKAFIMFDEKLTLMAREIFGNDIVDKGYVVKEGHRFESMSEFKVCIKKYLQTSLSDTINIGSKNIMIRFKNGKEVFFRSSEWGCIRAFNEGPGTEIQY